MAMTTTFQVAKSDEARKAWDQVSRDDDLDNEAFDEQFDYDAETTNGYMENLADGGRNEPVDAVTTARMVRSLDSDEYTSWNVALLPFAALQDDGHSVDPLSDHRPVEDIAEDIIECADYCKSRETAICKVADRVRRLLGWLEPVAEDYYGVPRIKAIAMLIRSESGLMTKEDRDEPGAWRTDPIGLTALGLAK